MVVDNCTASWAGDRGCQLQPSECGQLLALSDNGDVPSSETTYLYTLFE